jgi:ribose transport system permease protein
MSSSPRPAPAAPPSPQPPAARTWASRLGDVWIAGVFLVMVVVFSITAPGFLTVQNWLSTAQYTTEFLLLALGETFVILTAGIDLSVGATLGLSGVLSAMAISQVTQGGASHVTLGVVVGLLVALATGALVGLANGLAITRLGVTPFIVTLGMLGIVTGITYLITNGNDVTTLPQSLGSLGNSPVLHVFTVPVLVTAAVTVGASLFLTHTRFGIRTYAIGSSAEAARRTGINVKAHLTWVYTLAGIFASLAGFLVMIRFIDGSPIAGQNDELNAIAAVVIGGASLFGGSGTVLGTTVGSLIIGTLVSGLILLNVPAYWQLVLTGIIIVASVFIDQRRRQSLQG